jgi:hypothetical protein
MTALIIRPDSNTPGKKDYTGAFLPESNAFKHVEERGHLNNVEVVTFDNTLDFDARRRTLLKKIEKLRGADVSGLDCLAIFCHGWSTGIQAGITTKKIPAFLAALSCVYKIDDGLRVLLYCCSTGADDDDSADEAPGLGDGLSGQNLGDGSFADAFRDELCKLGAIDCRVVAHTTAGHTTQNPNVIIFEGNASPIGGVGGYMPVTKGHGKLWKTWVNELKTDYRFEYPFDSLGDIHDHLQARVK